MHRHVRRIGDEVAFRIEHRAREIEPLLDVHRLRGVTQRLPHLLGNRHVEVVEHLEQDRVSVEAETLVASGGAPRHHDIIARVECELPARLDNDGLVRLDHECRSIDALGGRDLVAQPDGRIVPGATGVDAGMARHVQSSIGTAGRHGCRPVTGVVVARCRARGLDLERGGDDGLVRRHEAKLRAVPAFEGGAHVRNRVERNRQAGIRAGILQMQACAQLHVRGRDVLCHHRRGHLARQLVAQRRDSGERFLGEVEFQRLLAAGPDRRQAHAIG